MTRSRAAALPLALLLLAGTGLAAPASPPPADVASVASDTNAFALDLYRAFAREPGNRFFSPFSVSTALGMTWTGAAGATAAEFQRALHATLPPERFHSALVSLAAGLGTSDAYELAVANRLFGQEGFDLLPPFLAATKERYGAEVGRVDFLHATEAARDEINGWVERQTHDRIQDLLHDGDLTEDTRLVLVNAIYFKGAWAAKFDEAQTRPGPFALADGAAVEAKLMTRTGEYAYAAVDGLEVLEIPYAGDRLSMVVLLPPKGGLPALEARLSPDALRGWIAAAHRTEVHVVFPKFRIESRAELGDALVDLGMTTAFDPDRADFSGMADPVRDPLFMSKVIHQAFVEVGEAGTEAAAATAVVMARPASAPRPVPTFQADHPFVFAIRDRVSGAILFMGRMADPR